MCDNVFFFWGGGRVSGPEFAEGTVSSYAKKTDDEATARRTIPARSFVGDMRSGMTDSALMEKYKLTARGLHSAFRKLLAATCGATVRACGPSIRV